MQGMDAMSERLQIKQGLTATQMAMRLSVVYFLAGGLWVLLTDLLVGALPISKTTAQWFSIVKGLSFVLVTTGIIYLLSRAGLTRVMNAQATAREQELRIRDAYIDVLCSVTGGKLVLVTDEELRESLGTPVAGPKSLSAPSELSMAREEIRNGLSRAGATRELIDRAVSATGEGLNNLLKHAGSGEYEVFRKDGVFQVKIADSGPGIDFKMMPKAIAPGFSTAQTLGMGFTIMLQQAERLLVCSEPGSTTLLIELQEH
jgi:anti-sigma regulatory factor (Ser/Thr protein kinase)